MKDWYSTSELVGLPGLPGSQKGVIQAAKRHRWTARPRRGRGGGSEYAIDSLPPATRRALVSRELQRSRNAEDGAVTGRAIREATTERPREDSLTAQAGFTGWRAHQHGIRAELYLAVDRYRVAAACTLEQAITAYNQGEIPVESAVKAKFPTTNRKTIERWRAAVNRDGLAALAPQYGNRRGQTIVDQQPDLRDFLIGMMVEYPHARAKLALQAARAHFRGAAILPSEDSLDRWMQRWRKANASAYTSVTNPDAWKNRYMAADGRLSEDVHALNQRWELDSTPADVECADGRYAIIGAIDIWSRRAKLFVSRTSKAEAIAQLLRRCIIDWGVPQEVVTDEGKDYVSAYARRVLADLRIDHHICEPFSPWQKGHIERLFRTYSRSAVIELNDAFVGHDVADRQAIRARRSFADQLFKKNDVATTTLTGAELQRLCDEWSDHLYANERHSEIRTTPAEKARSWTGTVARINNERALDLLLALAPSDEGWRTITKRGISIDGYWYSAPEVMSSIGDRVQCRLDEADMGRIYVYRPAEDGTLHYLCQAACADLTGITYAAFAAARRAISDETLKAKRAELRAAGRKIKKADVVERILDQARSEHGHVLAFPARATSHSTDALSAAEDALQRPARPDVDIDTRAQQLLEELQGRKPAQVITHPAQRQAPIDEVEERIARAQAIELSQASGQAVSADAAAWLSRYRNTTEYRAHLRFVQSFNAQAGNEE